MTTNTVSDFSLFAILYDIAYYGFFYILSFLTSLRQSERLTQIRNEKQKVQEKILHLNTNTSPSSNDIPSISIIIPSYNEEAHIKNTILSALAAKSSALKETKRFHVEVIVSDGGSKDRTREICAALAPQGVTVVTGGSCRAECQNIGAEQARGEILLFLHADTILPPNYAWHVCQLMQKSSNVLGAFGFDVDNPELRCGALLRFLVDFRSTYYSLPYGDQALFIRKKVFDILGGFPHVPLMEDYDLVQHVRSLKAGDICLVPHFEVCGDGDASQERCLSLRVKTSARRYELNGVVWNTIMNQIVIFGRTIGVPHIRLAKWYYGLSMKRAY